MAEAHIKALQEELQSRFLLNYESRWDSQEMIAHRRALAQHPLDDDPFDAWEDEVPNFFESIGLLLQKDQLDIAMVWNDFSYYALHWGAALGPYLAQKHEPRDVWEGFVYLVDALRKIESK